MLGLNSSLIHTTFMKLKEKDFQSGIRDQLSFLTPLLGGRCKVKKPWTKGTTINGQWSSTSQTKFEEKKLKNFKKNQNPITRVFELTLLQQYTVHVSHNPWDFTKSSFEQKYQHHSWCSISIKLLAKPFTKCRNKYLPKDTFQISQPY